MWPSRQWAMTKPTGVRHFARQACLRSVNWNSPAAISRAPPGVGHVHSCERGRLKGELSRGGGDGKAQPDHEIAGEEETCRRRELPCRGAAVVDPRDGEDHGRRRRQHHGDHHDEPHDDHQAPLRDAPRRGHGHPHARHILWHVQQPTRLHALHLPGEKACIGPGERDQDRKRRADHGAIAALWLGQKASKQGHRCQSGRGGALRARICEGGE